MKNTKYFIKVKRAYLVLVVVVTTFLFTTNMLYRRKEHELNILDLGDLPEVDPLGCVKAKESFDVEAVICVKKNDIYISGWIAKTGAWEVEYVQNIMKGVRAYKDAVLVDAGCNVGMYSIVAAAIGRNVVAVDAMADNLAYIRKSLELNNMSEKVVLVHNAISNTHATLYPVPDAAPDFHLNPGSQRVVDDITLQHSNLKINGFPVTSVTLPDIFSIVDSGIIILKMDIQGYECKALLTPGVFHTGHFIPYILMEWGYLSSTFCPEQDRLVEVLVSAGFMPRDAITMGSLPLSCLQGHVTDVLWVHTKAVKIWNQEAMVEC